METDEVPKDELGDQGATEGTQVTVTTMSISHQLRQGRFSWSLKKHSHRFVRRSGSNCDLVMGKETQKLLPLVPWRVPDVTVAAAVQA